MFSKCKKLIFILYIIYKSRSSGVEVATFSVLNHHLARKNNAF